MTESLHLRPDGDDRAKLLGSPPPAVSVIMPCHNAVRYVGQAIESVLAQTYPNVELIVVDDGSTDGSLQAMRPYAERIRLLSQPNQGAAAARNTGIRAARGEFLAFLDADDYWDEHFLETMIDALDGSGAVLAYCGWQIVGADGRPGKPFVPPDYEAGDKRVSLLRDASLWPIHGMLTYRQAVLDIGMFDTRLPTCEDYDLWLRLTFARPIKRVARSLAYYRWHKPLKETDKRGRDAVYLRKIKRDFIAAHPEWMSGLTAGVLRDCLDGGLLRRGRQCLARGEYKSAQHIFRVAWREHAYTLRDLFAVLPALLPEPVYRRLPHSTLAR